ncbi:MAG: hypothetical protein ABIQ95_06120 [Bdellovibrionia bacterium]
MKKITSLIKLASLSQLKSFTQIEDLQIEEPTNNEFPIRGHWMAVILLKGTEIKIIFKAHFMTKNATALTSNIRKFESEEKLVTQALDFIKEYCNMTVGAIKRVLGEQDISSGVSLPAIIRGFDDIFSDRADGKESFAPCWTLKNQTTQIDCSAWFEIYEVDSFAGFNFKEAENNIQGNNNIEFF